MRKVIFEGREWGLAHLCRELQIDRRTVTSRLDRGVDIVRALRSPARPYPSHTKKVRADPAPQRKPDPLIDDAIDIMVDLREVLISLSPTPRRERILAGVRLWLRQAGWR